MEATAKIKLQDLAADWVLEAREERTEGQRLRIWGWEHMEPEVSAGDPDRAVEGTERQGWVLTRESPTQCSLLKSMYSQVRKESVPEKQ